MFEDGECMGNFLWGGSKGAGIPAPFDLVVTVWLTTFLGAFSFPNVLGLCTYSDGTTPDCRTGWSWKNFAV